MGGGVLEGKERCVGSGEVWGGVWESVRGEWGNVLACEEKNGEGVRKCVRCGAPTQFLPHFPTSPTPPSPFPTSPLTSSTPQHPFLHLLSYLFPHLPFLSPHPNTFFYYPHISPHLLKVWRSFHVTKFLGRCYHVAKLLVTFVTTMPHCRPEMGRETKKDSASAPKN